MGRIGYYAGAVATHAIALAERYAPRVAFRAKRHFYRPDMEFGLRLLRRNGFAPRVVVDVGAYKGDWAKLCRTIFPEGRVLMVEPSHERVRGLRGLCACDPQLSVLEALAGAREQTVPFLEQGSNSGVPAEPRPDGILLECKPLDALLAGTPFDRPDLLKVDVQGYDLEVVKGANALLRSVEVVIIELSLIGLHPIAPSIREAIDTFDDLGFRLLDVFSFIRRPVDDALWQIDAVFARAESALGNRARGW